VSAARAAARARARAGARGRDAQPRSLARTHLLTARRPPAHWPNLSRRADHLVGTPKYGSVYFGDGIENSSLQFML
jgi:hypothetical protein